MQNHPTECTAIRIALGDVDIVPPGGREMRATHLLSNAFGFGGINACVAMRAA